MARCGREEGRKDEVLPSTVDMVKPKQAFTLNHRLVLLLRRNTVHACPVAQEYKDTPEKCEFRSVLIRFPSLAHRHRLAAPSVDNLSRHKQFYTQRWVHMWKSQTTSLDNLEVTASRPKKITVPTCTSI